VPRNNKGAKKNTISTKKYVKGHWKGFFPNNRQCQVKLGVFKKFPWDFEKHWVHHNNENPYFHLNKISKFR
jgi:hypothetical protein